MTLAIGTSGFDYPHWRGIFYPASMAAGERLAFYARHFGAVELNVTFYRMPAAQAFRGWAAAADEVSAERGGFVFAVKASRYLTHVKRLREPRESVEYLMDRAGLLGAHLGPILLQLPPDMSIELDRLDRTLEAFGRARVAVEPRHESWFSPELEALLRSRGAALCLADRRGPLTPIWRTAGWTYLRFHEGSAWPGPGYRDAELRAWAGRLAEGFGPAPEGFAFFNNDARGCALEDARRFEAILTGRE
jgi:uncharacterized protein YecE (DUF72 family)